MSSSGSRATIRACSRWWACARPPDSAAPVDEAIPGERTSRSVRFQLLDDLPTALLVSGYAAQVGAPQQPRSRPRLVLQQPDMCAGWVTGGVPLSGVEQTDVPPLFVGPVAPPVEGDDDPLAWHDTGTLPGHAMRRRRRLDVWEDGEVAMVEVFFRDSHMDPAGVETIVHEYTVHARVDPATTTLRSCHADVGALPWPKCPAAAASAARLPGTPVDGVRRRVRQDFVGTTTCTRLNDTLLSLEDIGGLLEALQEASEA